MSDNKTVPKAKTDTSSTGTVNKNASLSSVGAELAPEAVITKDGDMSVLDAGGNNLAKAPAVTPADAVLYPATGGLPDTGPSSKYVLGEDRGLKLFNETGDRVDRDGRIIDEYGDRVIGLDVSDEEKQPNKSDIPAAIRAEMDAGRAALNKN